MSILNYLSSTTTSGPQPIDDQRYMRSALEDMKHGLDLVFELKLKLDSLHPIAAEAVIRLLVY